MRTARAWMLTLMLLPATPPAMAAWKGEIAAGLLTTTGNAETQSLNGKLLLDYAQGPWKNRFSASALNTGDEEGTTAERYTAANKLDYTFDTDDYLFAAVEYEKDLFGGFRQRVSESVGYGRHLLAGPVHVWDAEIGAGARQTVEQETRDREGEFIGRLGTDYEWKMSDTSRFRQTVKLESGKTNTFTESVTELKLSIIGNLAAALSFTLRHNSAVPDDTKPTDSFTAVNLTYGFGAP